MGGFFNANPDFGTFSSWGITIYARLPPHPPPYLYVCCKLTINSGIETKSNSAASSQAISQISTDLGKHVFAIIVSMYICILYASRYIYSILCLFIYIHYAKSLCSPTMKVFCRHTTSILYVQYGNTRYQYVGICVQWMRNCVHFLIVKYLK